MSIVFTDGTIRISGSGAVDEAEHLLGLLLANAAASVDLSASTQLHTALWQVLMVCRPQIVGAPEDSFATKWIVPRIMSLS